jgi:hypothetical protein
MKIPATIVLFAFAGLFLFNCRKKDDPEPPPAPDPYTYNNELQSSKDITFSTLLISDIDIIMSFPAENDFYEGFHLPIPDANSGSSGTVTSIRDISSKYVFVSFSQTKCLDGRNRSGSISMEYDKNGLNAVNYHDFGFSSSINLYNYLVDGWKIELFDAAVPATIGNLVGSANYDPAHTNLSWKIQGKFKLTHPTDPGRNIIWDGTLVKTLINTGDTSVFSPSKTQPINWDIAKVQYTGTVTGTTGQTVSFNYLVDGNKPLTRDFNCAFVPPGSTGVTEFHPFVNGAATFTTANYHPRTIDYGPQNACDNSGTVSFKGETYNVNFD